MEKQASGAKRRRRRGSRRERADAGRSGRRMLFSCTWKPAGKVSRETEHKHAGAAGGEEWARGWGGWGGKFAATAQRQGTRADRVRAAERGRAEKKEGQSAVEETVKKPNPAGAARGRRVSSLSRAEPSTPTPGLQEAPRSQRAWKGGGSGGPYWAQRLPASRRLPAVCQGSQQRLTRDAGGSSSSSSGTAAVACRSVCEGVRVPSRRAILASAGIGKRRFHFTAMCVAHLPGANRKGTARR